MVSQDLNSGEKGAKFFDILRSALQSNFECFHVFSLFTSDLKTAKRSWAFFAILLLLFHIWNFFAQVSISMSGPRMLGCVSCSACLDILIEQNRETTAEKSESGTTTQDVTFIQTGLANSNQKHHWSKNTATNPDISWYLGALYLIHCRISVIMRVFKSRTFRTNDSELYKKVLIVIVGCTLYMTLWTLIDPATPSQPQEHGSILCKLQPWNFVAIAGKAFNNW